MTEGKRRFSALVIGASAGGIGALSAILPTLKANFPIPVCIAQHIADSSENYLVEHFAARCNVAVKEAEDKEDIHAGTIYFAPPNYHLLLEVNKTLALSSEEKVNYSRPSIDVLFETAAEAYQEKLIGLLLTGASCDGAAGLEKIHRYGGLTIVQTPESAEVDIMPRAALEKTPIDHVLPLTQIASFLAALDYTNEA